MRKLWLILFPGLLWVLEMFVRFVADAEDTVTFLGPSIASAGLGLLGSVAAGKPRPQSPFDDPGVSPAMASTLLTLGLVVWIFCLTLNIKRKVPPFFDIVFDVDTGQVTLALILYTIAALVTLAVEEN